MLSYRPSSQSVVVKLSGWCVHNEQQKGSGICKIFHFKVLICDVSVLFYGTVVLLCYKLS